MTSMSYQEKRELAEPAAHRLASWKVPVEGARPVEAMVYDAVYVIARDAAEAVIESDLDANWNQSGIDTPKRVKDRHADREVATALLGTLSEVLYGQRQHPSVFRSGITGGGRFSKEGIEVKVRRALYPDLPLHAIGLEPGAPTIWRPHDDPVERAKQQA
jgi:hypothetical protein